jgi:hypothetical protein
MVDEMEIINARKRHLLACTAMEREMFEVIKIILDYNYGVKFPKSSTLKVDYAEYDFLQSPGEIAREMELFIKYNIKSPIDYIMQYNPELSIQEAENIYRYNINKNRSGSGGIPSLMNSAKKRNSPMARGLGFTR